MAAMMGRMPVPTAPGAPVSGAPVAAPPGAAMPRPPLPRPSAGASPVSGLFLLFSFLAGAGLDKTAESLAKLSKVFSGGQPGAASVARAHRGGVRLDAAQNPGLTMAPQLAQVLAAKAANQPSGSDELVGLLSRALLANQQAPVP